MENNPGYHQRVYHPRSRLCLLGPYLCLLWTTLPSLMALRWVSFCSCVSLQFKSLFARLSCCFIFGKIDYIIYWLLTSSILHIKHSFWVFCFVCLFVLGGRGKRGSGNIAWARRECDPSISASRILGLQICTSRLKKRKYILTIFVNCRTCRPWTRRKGNLNARGKGHLKFLAWYCWQYYL